MVPQQIVMGKNASGLFFHIPKKKKSHKGFRVSPWPTMHRSKHGEETMAFVPAVPPKEINVILSTRWVLHSQGNMWGGETSCRTEGMGMQIICQQGVNVQSIEGTPSTQQKDGPDLEREEQGN